MERFGRIDTWVNNAGVSIFGRNEDIPLEDMQRLFQTNYWGVVHGSLEAVKHMKTRGGGAIINLGSELSDRSIPLQGMYSASKHAVKAFTDSLRMELEKEGAPISVTLVKPAAIDTMFAVHAKNYMDKEPALPPPVYAPELVAKSILYAAQHPKRDVFVGGAAKALSAGAPCRACSTAICARPCSSSSNRNRRAAEPPAMRCTRRTRTRKCASARTSPRPSSKTAPTPAPPCARTRSCRCWSAARPCSAPGSWRAAPAACARHSDAPSR
jgi:hypothetical protein